MKKKDRGLVSLALALLLLYRYFNPSTKSENAAYVLALVLPCRWWSLRTARCLSIPPLERKKPSWSTATPISYRYCAPVLHHQQAASADGPCLPRSTKTHHCRHAFANSVHPSPLLHDVVSHTLRGRRRSFGCCGSVLSTAQGSCTRDLCRDIEGKQPLLTTSSCRGGASYKQGQGAAP